MTKMQLHTPRSVRNIKETDDFEVLDINSDSALPPAGLTRTPPPTIDDDLNLADIEKLGTRSGLHLDNEGCTDDFPIIDIEKRTSTASRICFLVLLLMLLLIALLFYVSVPQTKGTTVQQPYSPDDSPAALHPKSDLEDDKHKFDDEGNHDTLDQNEDNDDHPTEPSKEVFHCFEERDELRHALLLSMKDVTVQDKYGPPSDWCITANLKNFSGIFIDVEPHMLMSISRWDVSHVTDMSNLFLGHTEFNEDISMWNVERVQDMSNMFYGATAFQGDLSQWNVQNVETMYSMFSLAKKFNSNLKQWDVSKVTNMEHMFQGAVEFTGDGLESWNVLQVTKMGSMFRGTPNFDGTSVEPWDVRNVEDMHGMFADCPSFDGDISEWKVEKVSSMKHMFLHATSFHQILSSWEVRSANDMTGMFNGATKFSDNLCPWKFRLPFTVTTDDMFVNTNCPFTTTPVYPTGPFCFDC